MALPRAVREAAERADAAHKAIYGNTAPAAPEPEVPVVESPPVEAAKPVEAPAPAVPAEDPWEVKYRVLAGKYSAEVPRMAEQLRELRDEIKALQERKPEPQPDPNRLTTEKVAEKFGEDFASAVGAVASEIADQRTAKLREELAPQVKDAADRAVRTERSDFMRELTGLVPDWQAIDREDGFTQFLDGIDPLSGRARRDFFNEADRSNNAARIAQFFSAYQGNKSPAAPAMARPSIEESLSPDSSRSSPSLPTGKKVWTQRDIANFYAAARKNSYTQDDYRRIESDIFAAQRENRIAA